MAADALSDLLRTVRLTGAMYFDIAARAPWAVEQPTPETILTKILAGAERLISYHVVVEGRCYANILGEDPIVVEAGEVIVFTRGDPHVMSSSPGMRAAPNAPSPFQAAAAVRLPFYVEIGDNGPTSAKLVCGFLACDARPFNPLLESLPTVIKAGGSHAENAGSLRQFIQIAMTESADKRAGGEGVLAKLSELMFIEVIRQYLERIPPKQAGWLAGIRDPFVGTALSLLHRSPAFAWTIENLATEVGQSRSAFAERFTELVGIPPMRYLTNWRMQIASGMLRSGNPSMAKVATEIGYQSDAAFSRAFKKTVGVSPSAWRKPIAPVLRQRS